MKVCTNCKVNKPLSEFPKTVRHKDGFHSRCKICNSVLNKTYYSNNKKAYVKRSKIQTERKVIWWNEYKRTLKCSNCNESRFWCLDFHHVDSTTKDESIGNMIYTKSREKIMKEVSKCIVLCKNCHADFHYAEA